MKKSKSYDVINFCPNLEQLEATLEKIKAKKTDKYKYSFEAEKFINGMGLTSLYRSLYGNKKK